MSINSTDFISHENITFVKPHVEMIAHTNLSTDDNGTPKIAKIMELDPDATDMENLVEFAGRACYQSFHKPNPSTSKNRDYIVSTVEDKKHYSIAEHAVVTFYITGVSRSFTHELVRHRSFGFSQLSQRFVDESTTNFVLPPMYWGEDSLDEETINTLKESLAGDLKAYSALVKKGIESGATRKQAREAARAVLPNSTETRIVVTGEVRSLKHMLDRRMAPDADAEIQEVARLINEEMKVLFPSLFN